MSLISPKSVAILALAWLPLLIATTANASAEDHPASSAADESPLIQLRSTPNGSASFAWGDNNSGQLGIGSNTDESEPVAIRAGENASGQWSWLSGGGDFSCGIDPDGRAYCWGGNGTGELGNGTTDAIDDDSVPGAVSFGDNTSGRWSVIDGGWNFNCGLSLAGAAYCWGRGTSGQLGTGFFSDDSLPAAVIDGGKPAGAPWTQLSVGYGAACGISGGSAYCWGYNAQGGLGDGSTTNRSSPTAVVTNLSWRHIAAGSAHSCGVDTSGVGHCWGWNADGQLGDGTIDDTSVPTTVDFAGTWKVIEAGEYNSCGISSDDELYCWGSNSLGQLGQGSTGADQLTPIKVPGLAGVRHLSMGEDTICAATTTSVYCWGSNSQGQVGNGTRGGAVSSPHEVTSGLFAGLVPRVLAVGSYHSMVLMGAPTPEPPAPVPAVPSSPPRDVVAVAGDASAALSWAAPISTGSFPVTNYLATSSPGGRTCLTSSLSCTVAGLSNGTAYTFTVQALTGAGWSPSSDPSEAVTPVAVPRPTITITGAREGKRISVTGSTTGMAMGAILHPWVRLTGQSAYSKGSASVLVSMDGTFTWSRRSGRETSVYMQTPDASARSNTVTISAR